MFAAALGSRLDQNSLKRLEVAGTYVPKATFLILLRIHEGPAADMALGKPRAILY
jgi:hypothetical protein